MSKVLVAMVLCYLIKMLSNRKKTQLSFFFEQAPSSWNGGRGEGGTSAFIGHLKMTLKSVTARRVITDILWKRTSVLRGID